MKHGLATDRRMGKNSSHSSFRPQCYYGRAGKLLNVCPTFQEILKETRQYEIGVLFLARVVPRVSYSFFLTIQYYHTMLQNDCPPPCFRAFSSTTRAPSARMHNRHIQPMLYALLHTYDTPIAWCRFFRNRRIELHEVIGGP